MNEQWLSIIEYARMHDISDMTVRRRIKKGKISAVLKDGKYFIPFSSSAAHTTTSSMGYEVSRDDISKTMRPTVAPGNISVPEQRPNNMYSVAMAPPTPTTYPEIQRPSISKPEIQSIESSLKRSMDVRGQSRSQVPSVSLENIKYLSQSILHEMQKDKTSVVSTQKLIEYCDSLIQSIDDQKKLLTQKFESERVAYQHEVKALQLENERYRQQIEDLHVLVKILEQKK